MRIREKQSLRTGDTLGFPEFRAKHLENNRSRVWYFKRRHRRRKTKNSASWAGKWDLNQSIITERDWIQNQNWLRSWIINEPRPHRPTRRPLHFSANLRLLRVFSFITSPVSERLEEAAALLWSYILPVCGHAASDGGTRWSPRRSQTSLFKDVSAPSVDVRMRQKCPPVLIHEDIRCSTADKGTCTHVHTHRRVHGRLIWNFAECAVTAAHADTRTTSASAELQTLNVSVYLLIFWILVTEYF